MTVDFKDIVTKKLIDIGAFGKSGMDISPMDIPLKGDIIKDDFNRFWEVIAREHYWTGAREHYWTGARHGMTLHLKQL